MDPYFLARWLNILPFACWAPVVHLQIRFRDLTGKAHAVGKLLPDEARDLYRIWFTLGWLAFGALTGSLCLMVTCPAFW
ncbi:DUF2269 domain-containing protein [Ruegeria sp. WL0004]|uniref:DUF2269 domain-containing protein n=1 Tax=Ruegeria marisflavi TaxID=2984152 RepID=A0ABT2WWI2_9RHOB|nr:DUF2269 domain-containing protein [Ruegeria sp. WL0004]MCU9838363.1 DUF2269 domain-containing protein [Ruegeria sp. WL0004]